MMVRLSNITNLLFLNMLLIILLLISNTTSQATVFPDHYIESDSPYSSSSRYLTSDIKERQIYKCFSCGAAGNVFKFLMDYENIGFMEAVKILAEKANIDISINTKPIKKENVLFDIYRAYFTNETSISDNINYIKNIIYMN